jgi:hypothetical protein
MITVIVAVALSLMLLVTLSALDKHQDARLVERFRREIEAENECDQ